MELVCLQVYLNLWSIAEQTHSAILSGWNKMILILDIIQHDILSSAYTEKVKQKESHTHTHDTERKKIVRVKLSKYMQHNA